MAMSVMFRLQRSTAGTADRRPKAAGRSELYAYHPEHDPGSYLDFPRESIGERLKWLIAEAVKAAGENGNDPLQRMMNLNLWWNGFSVLTSKTQAFEKVDVRMTEDKPTAIRRAVSLIKILWTVSIIATATAVGAYIGWENHGIVGALALGFVGLVVGGFLSSPSALLQVLS
ncbi:hypothetical protein [Ensifer sp. SL37]|uniref:hypothetical protein n=1 Tax=Ensifer sp. SL37 TaxID=2995137 RepID=UPI0022745AA3|nr:hypothetical protein [Ensifer sp. SL37]MCY1746343.1 hypothetical protein [Ensifer sp. SL37]